MLFLHISQKSQNQQSGANKKKSIKCSLVEKKNNIKLIKKK